MADENQNAGGGSGAGGNPKPAFPGGSLLGSGAIPLFKFAGIDVSLHWSWFLVAFYQISMRKSEYHSPVWKVYEYLALFGIVLLHEFGHAFACRQTGGKANHIMLWPLGGVAYVQPPPRPGAFLWSIAAGPLVNVVLLPVTWIFYHVGIASSWAPQAPDLLECAHNVMWINLLLLAFNMLPVYPLDGGQIVQALLWFVIGRTRSLYVVTVIGFLVGAGVVVASIYYDQTWFIIMGAFMLQRSVLAFQNARRLGEVDRIPRVRGFACPNCGEKPLAGELWVCDACGTRFNPFESNAVCPTCGKVHENTVCPFCKERNPIGRWAWK